jgi:hypothetical protein
MKREIKVSQLLIIFLVLILGMSCSRLPAEDISIEVSSLTNPTQTRLIEFVSTENPTKLPSVEPAQTGTPGIENSMPDITGGRLFSNPYTRRIFYDLSHDQYHAGCCESGDKDQ